MRTVGGKSSLLSLQWTPRAPYGASYMHGTHHLNNYHHNSKFNDIIWGFVRDPFKRCFGAASSLSSLRQTSRVSYGIHLYKCFQAASTLSSPQQTLRVSCEAPYETRLDPSGTVWSVVHAWDPHLNNYHHNSKFIGIIWGFVRDPFKRCFGAASSLSSLRQTSRILYGIHFYKCFQAASTLSSLQQTLRVLCEAPSQTHLDKCLG